MAETVIQKLDKAIAHHKTQRSAYTMIKLHELEMVANRIRELESAIQPGGGEEVSGVEWLSLANQAHRLKANRQANAAVREFEEWVKQTGALPWNSSWMAEVSSIIERAANGDDVKREG